MFHGGVVAQEADRGIRGSVQLREIHDVAESRFARGLDEGELLRLGALGGIRHQEGAFHALESAADARRVVEIRHDEFYAGPFRVGRVRLAVDHAAHRDAQTAEPLDELSAVISAGAGNEDHAEPALNIGRNG